MLTKDEFIEYTNALFAVYKAADNIYEATNHAFDLLEIDAINNIIETQTETIEKLIDDESDEFGEWICAKITNPEITESVEEFYDNFKSDK